MNEMEAAKLIASGALPSPARFGTFALWAIRITSTGSSYRPQLNEYVWRDPKLWLCPEALERVAALPVIFEHPAGALTSEEYAGRVVGNVQYAYIADSEGMQNDTGPDVWAVCRIYDADTIEHLAKNEWSTSPGVNFAQGNGNQTIHLKDGEKILIEESPTLCCHIALVANGVWDKGGAPNGIRTDFKQEPYAMTTEEQAAADKARNDAATLLAKINDTLSGLSSRMDSMEAARKDAAEKEEKERNDRARHDAARKDKFGRRDGESYMDAMKRWDAEEMSMCDEFTKGGDDEETAKKAAKDARKDAMESMRRADAESFEKWANEEEKEKEHKADKARKDAEEQAKKDAARMDATTAENADLRTRLAAMEAAYKTLTTETPASERDALAAAQARADSIAGMFGERASAPIPGEKPLDYRKRLINKFKAHSPRFAETRFDSLDASVIDAVEEIVYQDAAVAARNPAKPVVGRLIPIVTRENGRDVTRFTGDIMAWMAPFMTAGNVGHIIRNPNQGA